MEKVSVSTDFQYRTISHTQSNHVVMGDTTVEAGGTDEAPNPEELLLSALGSCKVMTLHMYADRKGWDLQKVDIDLEYEKLDAQDVPNYHGEEKHVHVTRAKITLHGNLDEEQRARLLQIADKCPVHRIISGPNIIETTPA